VSGPGWRWLRDRLGWDAIVHVAEKKEVPVHRHTFWHYWGE
jgi:hypothetical protein